MRGLSNLRSMIWSLFIATGVLKTLKKQVVNTSSLYEKVTINKVYSYKIQQNISKTMKIMLITFNHILNHGYKERGECIDFKHCHLNQRVKVWFVYNDLC